MITSSWRALAALGLKLLMAAALALPIGAFAANKTFTGPGNFSDNTKWNGNSVPGAGDNLTIKGACTFDNSASNLQYGSLTLGGSGVAGSVVWPVGGTNNLNVGAVSAGVAGSAINMTNGGTLQIRTSWTTTNMTFTPGAGTINWNVTGGASALPAAIATYNNLTITATGQTASLGVGTTVNGALLISAGTLSTSGSNFALVAKGSITGAGGLTGNASAISVSGDMTVTTFTAGTSSVTFNGGGAQAVGGAYTFNNLTINKGGGTATLGGNTSVGGALTITAGTLSTSASNFSLGVTGAITGAGTLIGNGSTIGVGGNMTGINFTAGTSTVNVNGGGAQTIGGVYTFNNLTINKGGGTATLGGNTLVGAALTITAGTLSTSASNFSLGVTGAITGAGTLTANGSTISVGGNMTGITFTAGTSTVNVNGGGAQTIGGTYTFNNLTINKSAGTATLGGATTVNVNLAITQGTLADGGFQITGGTGTMTMASGTSLNLGNGANNTAFPTSYTNVNITLNSGSTVTYQSTGAQTVSGVPTYANLTINKTASTGTLGAATTVTGALTISSGTLDTSSASNLSLSVTGSITGTGGTLTINNSAVSVGGDMTVNTFNAGAATSNVTFNGTGAQQVGGVYTFRTLTINKTSGTATLGGATAVNGNLVISNGTLADGGFQITGGTGTMSMASGTSLLLGTSSNTLFPTNFTSGNIALNAASTVTYQSAGAQTVSGTPTYGNLVIDKASATGTLGAGTTVAGTLMISAGTLDTSSTSSFSLSVTGSITGAGGTLTINNSAVTVGGDMTVNTFNAGAATSNVTFNGTGAQQVGGAYTFRTLTISKSSGTATLGGSTSVGSDLAITAGTLSTSGSGFNLSVTGNVTGNGALTANGSAISIGGNMTVTTFTAGTSTVQFNGTGAQTIGGTYSFSNLSINKASGIATLGGATSVTNNLTISLGSLDDGGFQITGNGTGTLSIGSGTSLSLGAGTATTFPTNFTAGHTTLNAASTVTYAAGVAQTVSTTPTYGNLTFSGANTKTTASGTLNVAGNWSAGSTTALNTNNTVVTVTGGNLTGAGSITQGSGLITVAGDWSNTGTLTASSAGVALTGSSKQITGPGAGITFNTLTVNGTYTNNNTGTITVNTALSGSGTLTQGANSSLTLKGTAGLSTLAATASPNTVTYNGSASQAAVATTYNNLTINNSSGVTLAGNATVNATLTLTSGNISAGSNTVIIPAGGTVSRTSGHIVGSLRKNVATGATSRTYEVGDASGYTPMTVAFGNVTAAGDLTVKATAGAHPDLTNSGLDPTQSPTKQSVNRYWTATNSGVAFNNYTAAVTYLSGDLDAGLDLTTVGIAKADSCAPPCAWTFPTMSGTATATTAQAGGMTSFSDFGVGRRVDHFVVSAPPAATQNTGFSVTITAVDKNGNTVNGFTGTATITSTNGNCTISAGGTTGSFTSGTFTGNVTISNACSDTLKATMTGNSGVTGTSAGNVAVAAAVSSFNVFETSTAANATTGQIFTKLAGIGPFGLDVVAISGGAQVAGFSANVKVELLANSTPGANYAANNCPTANTVVQTVASFAVSGGRSTVSLSAVATAYRDVRVRVTYPTSSPTVTSCSTDSFSIRPSGFTVTSTIATNNGTSGAGIKTGASFDLSAAASAGYDLAPSIDQTKIVGSPNAGSIAGSFGAANSGIGTATGAAFTYSEVGNFGLNTNAVYDASFTSIDQPNDCAGGTDLFSNTLVASKYGCNFGSTAIAQTTGSSGFGRFIPDNFDVSLNSPTLAASCGVFTYVGRTFVFGTAPTITVTARNGSALGNAATKNYAGSYVKLTNSTLTPATQSARYSSFDALGGGSTPALVMTGGFPNTTADPAIGTFTNGVATLTFATGAAGEGFLFNRSTTTPSAPFNADIALTINVIDGDNVAYAGNPVAFGNTATAGNGIAFSGGKAMRFGRLRILPATGVASLPLNVPFRAEYWNGGSFVTNTDDSCTQIARANVKQSAYQAPLAACDTIISTTPVTLSAGLGTLRLAAPSGGHTGSVTLAPQLAGTAGTFCNAVGGGTTGTSSAGLSYLQGKWNNSPNYDQDPSARAAFGVYGSQPNRFIFFRENY